ncbi:MAG: hypothetical protein QOJ88_1303 [Pyrinomonadaceae bacterium]|jgi:hypothetical protein|nr:hypothetical protein [Pyrinomonadaceae bacterium]
MPIWFFNVTHLNQTTTVGSKNVNPPGNGNSVTIANVPCNCGYSHTLIGTQSSVNGMSGSGATSVAPPNDPHSEPSIKGDAVPSWDGSPSNPEEDNSVDEEESDNEDAADDEDDSDDDDESDDEDDSDDDDESDDEEESSSQR